MQVTWASWTTFIVWIIGLIISAALIIAVGTLATWLLKRFIGVQNFPALTMLLAVCGGLAAIYTSLAGPRERSDQQARLLAFATDIATKNMFLVATGDKITGEVGDTTQIDPTMLRLKLPRLEAMSKALNDIPVADMPSAMSMTALIRARAGSNSMVDHAKEAIAANRPGNLDLDIVELGNGVNGLQNERDRLYPIYNIGGGLAVGKLPQQR